MQRPEPQARRVTTLTLRHDSLPMRLYHEAKRLGAWDPRDLELESDAGDWARLSVVERDVVLRLTALFLAAEESMTRDLLPLLMTVVREDRLEEELFLTTFLAEEAKHTEFFRRVLDEVCRQSGELTRFQTPSFRRLFSEKLPTAMKRLLVDASPTAQAEALVTYTLVGEGVLGDAGYHVLARALDGIMPGFRAGLARAQADEARHMAYGQFLLSRLVATDADVWDAIGRRMDDLLPVTLGIVSEFFEPYDQMPFGLSLADTIEFAIAQFAARWAELEQAREKSRRRPASGGRVTPTGDREAGAVSEIRAWLSRAIHTTTIEVGRDATGRVWVFQVGPERVPRLLITQDVLDRHTPGEILAALGERVGALTASRRSRLTCMRIG
ncbi:MAG TPA: R2-like ligand-binding oxidase, partial [Candidatus Dormibacteraeota bacterium]|nr:R2-like ligand-binding oxidase [Candidatus Dormibacteraeota bacterium]